MIRKYIERLAGMNPQLKLFLFGMLGLGIRGTWSNVDLSEISSSSDLIGTSVFATYTAGF